MHRWFVGECSSRRHKYMAGLESAVLHVWRNLHVVRRTKLTDRDRLFLKLFVSLLKSQNPREVSSAQQQSVVIISDACYERDSRNRICGLGGELVDNSCNKNFFFSVELSDDQRSLLGEKNKKQIIFEAETLCALVAYSLWAKFITSRQCFLYVDNEGTKSCLMKGWSENHTVDISAQVFAETEVHVRTLCWIARVSSFLKYCGCPFKRRRQSFETTEFSSCFSRCNGSLETALLVHKCKIGENGWTTKAKWLKHRKCDSFLYQDDSHCMSGEWE